MWMQELSSIKNATVNLKKEKIILFNFGYKGNRAPKANKELREHLKTCVWKREKNPSYLLINLCFTFVSIKKAVNRG